MPTIEIASINSIGLGLNQEDFDIAIIEENKLESHRGLFYDLLQQQNGVIVHIGNPNCKSDENVGFVAGTLVDWSFEPGDIIIPEYDENDLIYKSGANHQFSFKFLAQFKYDIDKILKLALDNSPIKKVCFLTDFQFGPEKAKIEIIYSITDFWIKHDNDGLDFNTLYEMYIQ